MKLLLSLLIIISLVTFQSKALDTECSGSPNFSRNNSIPSNWNACYGIINFFGKYKGDVYMGEFKDGKFHGKGTYYYKAPNKFEGHKYQGIFKDGKAHGEGAYFFNDGVVHIIEHVNGNYLGVIKKYAQGEYNYDHESKREKSFFDSELRLGEQIIQNEKEIIASDKEPPKIAITSSDVKDKQGIIEGVVLDNIKVAELIINGEEVNFDTEGNFNYTTFIPKKGKDISIQVTDTKGLSSKKIVALQREKTSTNKELNFSELNPLKLKADKNKNAIALIIGISNYENAPEAKYADRDANYFADFSENILGIRKDNIKLVSNAKANQTRIKTALKIWLKGYSTPEESDIYIFFAGHGLASTDGKELYLLPYDGEPRLLEDTALLRSEIFNTVKSMQPKSVTVFLDTCYSGQTREKDMILADVRPIAIVPVESDVPENFTVFSASSGSEISGSLPEADHGLFSYFLMKGLEGDADANNDKKITNGELHSYVRSNVTRQAIRLGREQTPELKGDLDKVLVEFN